VEQADSYEITKTLRPCDRCKSNDYLYKDYPFSKPMPGFGLVEMVGDICGICRVELHHRTYTAGA
jgi:predicted  nucleic acid-binding Zn-ribbon protein